ncbi:FG-GAP-like repeat-containing protein [Micromonospora viridifaciens]|uniref:FG-GAP-like repeat-containing protein n=1 Tax=Micromonospora viridifaciens TaxID=1881 RepID=UPI0012FDB5AB
MNGDGNADLVGINVKNDCLYRFNGNGSGGVGSGVQVGCGWGNYIGLLGLGDFNRDGKGDLVAMHTNGDLYRWHGNGSGGFSSGSVIARGNRGLYVGPMTRASVCWAAPAVTSRPSAPQARAAGRRRRRGRVEQVFTLPVGWLLA